MNRRIVGRNPIFITWGALPAMVLRFMVRFFIFSVLPTGPAREFRDESDEL